MSELMENDIPKYRKKKNSGSKSQKRSSHKHEYEKIIIKGYFGSYWSYRCKICGRTKSLSFSCSSEGLKKDIGNRVSIRSSDYYTVEELHEKFPDIDIYYMPRDEKDNLLFGDEYLTKIVFEENKEESGNV